ncbi:MAG: hypothetical protein ACK5S6_03430 [bacterium]|jgi:hypothetical protein
MTMSKIAERLQAKLVRAMADADQVAFHNDEQGRKASALLMAGKSLAFEEVMAWIVELEQCGDNARLNNEACDSERRSR